jgi:hypothetical protein
LESRERIEVVARGILPQEFDGAELQDGLVRFTVSPAAQREAIERVWLRGGELVRVSPVRRSLEDVFLEFTSADKVRGSASSETQTETAGARARE